MGDGRRTGIPHSTGNSNASLIKRSRRIVIRGPNLRKRQCRRQSNDRSDCPNFDHGHVACWIFEAHRVPVSIEVFVKRGGIGV